MENIAPLKHRIVKKKQASDTPGGGHHHQSGVDPTLVVVDPPPSMEKRGALLIIPPPTGGIPSYPTPLRVDPSIAVEAMISAAAVMCFTALGQYHNKISSSIHSQR